MNHDATFADSDTRQYNSSAHTSITSLFTTISYVSVDSKKHYKYCKR
jgi:hypothetical protein